MNKLHILALLMGTLLLAAPFTSASAADDDDDDDEPAASSGDVVVLTKDNWDSIVKTSKFALVEFYAPWCGHCKNLEPHYNKAATILKEKSPEVVIAKVDATEQPDLAGMFEVKGYPTIKWFIDGEAVADYNGGRDADGIVTWISKKTGPFATTVESVEALKDMEKDNEVLMVAYFKKFEGSAYDTFKSTASKIEDVVFIQTTDAAVAKAAGLAKEGLVVVKNFVGEERATLAFEAEMEADALKEWITAEKMPLTIEFTQGNSEKIFNSGIKKQIFYWGASKFMEASSKEFATLRAIAKAFKGQLVIVTANKEKESADPITNYFGLKKEDDGPKIFGFFMEKNKKYRFAEDLTEAALTAFAKSVVDGTAAPDYKSAPIPDEPLDEGVVTVVGKNFDAIVLDETKDVLLEVYAPWCGHCKKLTPIYSKLAKRFSTVDSVVIAKMDGTENEHDKVEAKGYPTILLYPADKTKEPISFEGGDRSLKALTKFIKDNAKTKYTLPKKSKGEEEKEDKDEL